MIKKTSVRPEEGSKLQAESPSRRMLIARKLSIAGRLDTVSATFEPGTITAICGPNGAGKSTLLSVLAGLLVPGRGRYCCQARI